MWSTLRHPFRPAFVRPLAAALSTSWLLSPHERSPPSGHSRLATCQSRPAAVSGVGVGVAKSASSQRWSSGAELEVLEVTRAGNVKELRRLLESGVQVDGNKAFGVLKAAFFMGKLDAIKILVEFGSDIKCGGAENALLKAAVAGGHMDTVKYIVEQGCDLTGKAGRIAMDQAKSPPGDAPPRVEVMTYLAKEMAQQGATLQVIAQHGELADVLSDILKEKPHLARTATQRDEEGRTALDTGARACKEVLYPYLMFLGRFTLERQLHESEHGRIIQVKDMQCLDGDNPRTRVLKLLKDKSKYDREQAARLPGSGPSAATVLEAYEGTAIQKATRDFDRDYPGLSACKYAFLMERADLILGEAIIHDNLAGIPASLPQVKSLMQHIAEALVNLHLRGLIHRNFRPLKAARFGERWLLIDLDSATKIGHPIRAEVSSSCDPPEVLIAQQKNVDELGVIALETFDVWSFGVVLFNLLSGETLFHVDQKGNFTAQGRNGLINWTHHSVHDKHLLHALKVKAGKKDCEPIIHEGDYRVAEDLLSKLLHPDPKLRIQNFEDVLKHPFFQEAGSGDFLPDPPFLADLPACVDQSVYDSSLQLALTYAKKGVEGDIHGHTLVLGDMKEIFPLGSRNKFDPFCNGVGDVRDKQDCEEVRRCMNADGMTLINGLTGAPSANKFFAVGTSPRASGGARSRASLWIAENSESIVIKISEDTDGQVTIHRGRGPALTPKSESYP